MKKANGLTVLSVAAFVLLLTGCHYRIINPESGRTYYTTGYKDYKTTGSIRFRDKLTGRKVTLHSWESEQISQEEFKTQTETK